MTITLEVSHINNPSQISHLEYHGAMRKQTKITSYWLFSVVSCIPPNLEHPHSIPWKIQHNGKIYALLQVVRLGKQTSILKLIVELLQRFFMIILFYSLKVFVVFSKIKTAMMSLPDQIKETPEGSWKRVGLGSPEESNMGPGLAHVIKGR